MALYEAPWEKYLSSNKDLLSAANKSFGTGTRPEGFGTRTTVEGTRLAGQPDLAQAQKEFEAEQLVAQSLGADATGKPSKGFLSKALDVITFLPAVATAAVKEFVVDPMYQYAYMIQDANRTPEERAQAQDRERVSIEEFKKNVKERNFAQEMYKPLAYEKDAPIWEKFLKEAAGFGIDIASTGGFGTGLRTAGVLGRRITPLVQANVAEDLFRRRAVRLVDESDSAFEARAADFGARVGVASATRARSRSVRKVFEEEFNDPSKFREAFPGELFGIENIPRTLFNELPKDAKGGLQVLARGRVVANFNAGGYATDDVAKALGLDDLAMKLNVPTLSQTTEKLVGAYQNTRNVLRGDTLKVPVVATAVGKINKLLDNIGGESGQAYGNFVRTAVSDAKERDVINAFKGFQSVPDVTAFRQLRGQVVEDTQKFFQDFERIKKAAPAAYDQAYDFMRNPARALEADVADPDTELALRWYGRFRYDLDRYHKLLLANGFDVDYQDNFLPLFYVQGKDQEVMGKFLGVGPQNIPGAGYRPEKARTKFMKDKVDPVTKKVLRDENDNPLQVPMFPAEVKDMFLKMGRKDLADMIEDDPLKLLARYSTNVSRMLATKVTIDKLLARGVLWRSTAMQMYPDQAKLQDAISKMDSKELTGMLQEFVGQPGKMSEYFERLNDDLAKAYSTGDQTLIAQSRAEVEAFINSLTAMGTSITKTHRNLNAKNKRLEDKLAKEQSDDMQRILDENKLLSGELGAQREYIKSETTRLEKIAAGEPVTGEDFFRTNVADTLAAREGIDYVPVGGSDKASATSFYLTKELAELTGEKAIVDLIDRTMLLRAGKGDSEVMKSVDQYLQFFRVGATFGRLSGFVLRNGYGAVQNNVLIAGSTAADHAVAAQVGSARLWTDIALQPLAALTRADLATKRVDKLIQAGRLTEAQAKSLRDDLATDGIVSVGTVDKIREEVLEDILSKKSVKDGVNQWDVYQTMRQGGVYDKYVVLPYSQAADVNDDVVDILGRDPDRFVVRTDKAGKERNWTQKGMESILNFGGTINADVFGRTIKLRPAQLTRDANEIMEEFVRGAPIVTGLRKYGADKGGRGNAIMLMKAAQFDYSDLSEFERKVLRRGLPFYTYMKNNIAAQTRVLFNDPERIRRNLMGWEAVGNVLTDENGENYVIPDYISEMYGFLIDDDIRKAIVKKSPPWLQAVLQNPLAFRPESPVLDIERYTRGGFGEITEELVSSSNPLSKAIMQVVFNENLFSGREYTNEDPAPNWYIGLSKILDTASGGAIDLGVRKSDKTGEFVTNGKFVDIFKTLIPQIGTLERSALPLIDAAVEAATGEQSNLSGTMSERGVSNLLSQLGGLNIVTITPTVEEGVYRNMRENINNTVDGIALDNGISREKLREFVYRLRDQGYNEQQIFQAVEEARQNGELVPDVG